MLKPLKWTMTVGLLSIALVACGNDEVDETEDVDTETEETEETDADDSTTEESDDVSVGGNETDADTAETLEQLDEVEEALVVYEGEEFVNVDLTLSVSEDEANDDLFERLESDVTEAIDERPIDLIVIVDGTAVHQSMIED
ncbi:MULTISPECIES: hypothetical protein [unclassified Geomicrobium]|uniref:hypothetical protein n=1 Tax=unclassified Geomicrobium TaxID=2628951 RepID=UPI00045ED22D|nr:MULTISPECIES: hypothetical protein [unclassified Geomicrobium]GAJ97456.1 hypothetical protein JCM19055_316 [Geomicrobium sp. JCM 19055]GAK07151.1 hypothetical protein JCM19038_871 [Geomicrobium sp. JCM 19038]